MRYTKPEVLSTRKASATIQERQSSASSKPAGAYFDRHIPPVSCTALAYEADE
jgi:hypothetical protein